VGEDGREIEEISPFEEIRPCENFGIRREVIPEPADVSAEQMEIGAPNRSP